MRCTVWLRAFLLAAAGLGLAVPSLADGGAVTSRVPPPEGQVAVMSGDVTLYGAGDRLLLLVDRSDLGEPADGAVELVVRFGIERPLPQGRLRAVRNATLLVRRNRVILTAAAGPVALELTVAGEGAALPLVGLPQDAALRDAGAALVGGAAGFELAVVDLSREPVRAAAMEDQLARGSSPLMGSRECAREDCESGGVGATSCGVSCVNDGSCSVACGQGWFACCGCDPGARCFCCRLGP